MTTETNENEEEHEPDRDCECGSCLRYFRAMDACPCCQDQWGNYLRDDEEGRDGDEE